MDILTFALTILIFSYIFLFIFHKGNYSVRYFEYLGVVVFSTVGTAIALEMGYSPFISVSCGMVTALGGGTLRDIIVFKKKPSWLTEHSLDFVIAVLAGSAMYIGRKYFSSSIIPGLGVNRQMVDSGLIKK